MPKRNAAKKAAKKTAKKLAHPPAHDLRRAYEHLGRIEILEGSLSGSPFVDVAALATVAQQQLGLGESSQAVGLLRAAEHICFAALAPTQVTDALMNADLKRAIAAEFERLMSRAEEEWNHGEEDPAGRSCIEDLYLRATVQARRTFQAGAFRPALEFARAAEALSQVRGLRAALADRGLASRLAS